MRVQELQVHNLRQHGFAMVPDFLTPDELAAARENLFRYFPSAQELNATPQRYGELLEEPDAGQREFPFAGDALNDISTHPVIVALVENLLGTSDVLLSQSAIWAKYGNAADYEQGLHLDYQGNTLVVPRDDGDFRQVNMILYYTDVTEDLGPTMVVSQEHTREIPLWPAFKTRKKNPDLYKLERPILAKAGSLLIFSMRTFHRASDISADVGERFSHHLVYRSANHNFQGYHLWPKHGEDEELQRFIQRSTPRQREVLGFPKVGDRYWNDETIRAVSMRYPGMDVSVYAG
jgi:hypothetical protein